MLALTVQVPTLPEVIKTSPVAGVIVQAPPVAWRVTAVPPGAPVTVSVADLPYANDEGGGGLNDNVGDSRIGVIKNVPVEPASWVGV